jgi:glycerol-1-phosphate dehydrogenase [NAD(P)+]
VSVTGPTPSRSSQARLVAIPRVLDVGRGALAALGRTLGGVDLPLRRVLLVRGRGPSSPLADAGTASLVDAGAEVVSRDAVSGTHDEAARLGREASRIGASVIVGVGGGRVIDVAKVAACHADRDVVTVPTSIASDGICSPIASLADDRGHKQSVPARMPVGVVLDTDVVAGAPRATRCAGLGDLLSNLVASLDWRLAGERHAEAYDSYSALIAESAARSALRLTDVDRPDDIEVIAKGLILSGLAMETAGTSRPCSGSEHLISHSLDRLLGPSARLHGQQVALGAMIASEAHGGRLTPELRAVFTRCGLPTHPDDLGLALDVVVEAVRRAPSTRPSRYTVLSEIDLGAAAVRRLVERAFAGAPAPTTPRPPSAPAPAPA